MITTGVTGREWRASIRPSGTLQPWEGEPLRWFVAAEDRWHVPDDEPTVRQTRVDGTAVAETRVRVPQGDVVHTVYSVSIGGAGHGGGITIAEVHNESTAAVAVAFDRRDVLTERPIADVPVEGIDLPDGAFVTPLAHAATVRIGVPHGPWPGGLPGALPVDLPSAQQVASGWSTLTERAGRFVLPDGGLGTGLAARVTAERCELALGVVPRPGDDPAGFAVALDTLVRMGEQPDPWLPELVAAVEEVGPRPGWDADAALAAAGRVLDQAGEDRARRDLDRIIARRSASGARRPAVPPGGGLDGAWLETLLVEDAALLPHGLPDAWLGQPIECYGVPTRGGSSVSFAMRWHGERPAILWEQAGAPIELTAPVAAPGWHTTKPSGEALWPTPQNAPT